MAGLSSSELSAIRDLVDDLLPDTGGAVLSVTNVSDGMGGNTQTWGTAAGTLSYRLDPLRGVEQVTGEGINAFQAYRLTLPYDTTITTAHRFEDGSGNQYAVKSVDGAKSWKASVRAVVEAV